MVGENERQRGPRDALWERFGVRILAYLICTPVLLLLVTVPIAVLAIVMFEDAYDVPSNMPSILGYALSQLAPLVIPVILVELRNRKRGWAVPLWVCSLFVVTFSTVPYRNNCRGLLGIYWYCGDLSFSVWRSLYLLDRSRLPRRLRRQLGAG